MMKQIYLAIFFATNAIPSSLLLAKEIAARDLLAKIASRESRVENIRYRVEWIDLVDEEPQRYSIEEVHSDDLGRMRVRVEEVGMYDENGDRRPQPIKTDRLFDGELLVEVKEREEVDGRGYPLIEKFDGKSRHAIVSLPQPDVPSSIESHRTPMTLSDHAITVRLKPIAELDRNVEIITGHANGELPFVVRFPYGESVVELTLAPKHDWAITDYRIKSSSGDLQQVFSASYERSDSGVCLPSEGSLTMYPASATAVPSKLPEVVRSRLLATRVWRFTVSNIKVNDSTFDESVFNASLPAHTNVSDARFGVSYRVGDDAVTDAELDRLAQIAIAAPTAEVRPFPKRKEDESTLRSVGLWVASAVFVLICLFVLSSRYLRK